MIEPALQWILSMGTLTVMWLAGDKRPLAWVIGLPLQALWTTWALMIGAYGLLPVTIGLLLVYARNLYVGVQERGI